ncbi:MAG: hypothetical protein M3081_02270 [Gemmatimonadota bacterium]|nr:hypothetical protein [Gemmatimonadota bacterium]
MTGPLSAASVADVRLPRETDTVPRGLLRITALAVIIAVSAACAAVLLTSLIGLITNAAFYGRFSTAFVSPAHNRLGL